MRKTVQRAQVSLLILGIIAVVAYGRRPTSEIEAGSKKRATEQSKLIRQAGRRLGVSVRTERMIHFARAGALWFAAPAANLESIPATELPRGVNLGVAYFDLPGQKFRKGFYKIRVFADVKQVGRFEGKGQLISDKGEIVGEFPAKVEVTSMTVPEGARSQLTTVSICTGAACNTGGAVESGVGGDYWHCSTCPNGFTVCCHLGGIFEDV